MMASVLACESDDEPAPAADAPDYEGISQEEIQRNAESMTPEQAESLGIVDTTISAESPINPDTSLLIPPDSLRR
jgi:hypothetical protein